MRVISAAEVEAALDFESLVERLRQAFRRDIVVPLLLYLWIHLAGVVFEPAVIRRLIGENEQGDTGITAFTLHHLAFDKLV